jgi:hypothetical protein
MKRADIIVLSLFFFYVFLVIVGLFVVTSGTTIEVEQPKPNRYFEEPYTLDDGTLCTILKGKQNGRIAFMICNYNRGAL